MKAGFIGAGKVGFSLGKYFAANGARPADKSSQESARPADKSSQEGARPADRSSDWPSSRPAGKPTPADWPVSAGAPESIEVVGYYSRSAESARAAAEFTGSRAYESLAGIVRESDALFLTVPDGEIEKVWREMRDLPIKNKDICHCSGSISSAVFFNAEERGACAYSLHPLYAFSDRESAWQGLAKAAFTLEGSSCRLKVWEQTLAALGNPLTVIDSRCKSLYHCAAVMVSNHIVALVDIALEMLEKCGFARQDALQALAPLISGNAAGAAAKGPKAALTGPVERNDVQTVASHLAALAEAGMTDEREIYRLLTGRLTDIAAGKHPQRDYEALRRLLAAGGRF